MFGLLYDKVKQCAEKLNVDLDALPDRLLGTQLKAIADAADKSVGVYSDSGWLAVHDSSCTEVVAFKAHFTDANRYLYYELATPIETDISALMSEFSNMMECESGGNITFKQQDNMQFEIPSNVDFAVNTPPNIASAPKRTSLKKSAAFDPYSNPLFAVFKDNASTEPETEPEQDPDTLVCPYCGKTYVMEYYYNQHLLTHKGGEE